MSKKNIKLLCLITGFFSCFVSFANDIKRYDRKVINYALLQLSKKVKKENILIVSSGQQYNSNAELVILLQEDEKNIRQFTITSSADLKPGGYIIRHYGKQLVVVGADAAGALYGALDIKEQLAAGKTLLQVTDKKEEPRFEFRAIKFNLPWMAYRQNFCLTQQDNVVRDLKFWEAFLDMMAENRFNVLSLWSLHPFHYMVKPKNFPEATSFTDVEMLSWKHFWTKLFDMAHERGIQTYLINWNTFVSPSFATANKLMGYNARPSHFGAGDTAKIIETYTKEIITQVINEYPGLDGLGITLGERMGGQIPDERRAWLDRTIFAGMKDANRKIKFVYRAPLSANEGSGGSTSEDNDLHTRQQIEGLDIDNPAYVEFKYNWSHGHSSPKLFIVHGGKLTDKYKNPLPIKYKYVWTVRNEDFYLLRWGQPDFVREFIKNNGDSYVGGCFLGSEVFIPAMDFMSKEGSFKNWQYHFQRQWLWYASWGRLLYNPQTSDKVFEDLLAAKYNNNSGKTALSAWKHASNNQLWFADFHMGKVDGSIYTEGFCRWPDSKEAVFFDINNIIQHPVLDTTLYINITDWIKNKEITKPGILSPLDFARKLDMNNEILFKEINVLRTMKQSPAVLAEINDLEAWYWFGRYFSDKVKAGVHVARYRFTGKDERADAVKYLASCKKWWMNYANTLAKYNNDTMPFHTSHMFSWKSFQKDVDKDIELAVADR
jgi:hypothetical protein